MRITRQRSKFRQDFKRASSGRYRNLLRRGGELEEVIRMLSNDEPLPPKYRDHALHHNHEGKRECHLRPDFLLIYWYEGNDCLILDRIGTHSDLVDL